MKMRLHRRVLAILLTLCVAFTMMPLAGIEGMTAYAEEGKGAEKEYLDVPAKFDKEIDISKVTGDIVINDSKTYRIYSSEKKTVNHKIKIQKPTLKNIEPHVFIDGISIAMDAGSKCPAIEINNKASAYLYFYGGNSGLRGADYRAAIQKNRSEGDLHILVAGGTKLFCTGGQYAAGIGGSADRNTNWYNIDMYGHGVRLYFGSSEKNTKWNGEIRATGGKNGAGIGAGRYGTGEYIHFMSGKITAKGGAYGAGIGGGRRGNGNYISVYGGEIDAQGGDFAAGIGSGFTQSAKSIRIYGGTVTAKAGSGGAGIGSGSVNTEDEAKNISVSDIEISGGMVTAEGRTSGAGIGGGQFVRADNIKITGGTVNARSTYGGAGIGGGSDAIGQKIYISGGNVHAKSYGGAGIGGGIDASGDSIHLSGGYIKAECGKNIGNSPVAFGNGANYRNSDAIINGAEAPETDIKIVLTKDNFVDMNITAECLSLDGIRGYKTFKDSITGTSQTEIDFTKLSLPDAQGYGKITISAELTFRTKAPKHQCVPAARTKNMGRYHIYVCQTCDARMFYNLTAKERHDNLDWNTETHQKYCVKCDMAIEQDTQAPTITGIKSNGAYYIPSLPDGSPLGFQPFYVTDEAKQGEVASGVEEVWLGNKKLEKVNGSYQIPANSGSFGSPENPYSVTITVKDYAGNTNTIENVSVYQKFLVIIKDSDGKTIYSHEFNDGSKPFIQLGLPENATARIIKVGDESEKYDYQYDADRKEYGFQLDPIKENCTFRLEQATEYPKVAITQNDDRSWTSYEANSDETVYLPKDGSIQFAVTTDTNSSAEYYVSGTSLQEEELKNSEIQWTLVGENGAIIIENLDEFYIYAKAENAKGTTYVSSSKIVLDGSAPIAKVDTNELSDDAYYWNGLKFTVEDADGSPVTVRDNNEILLPDANGVYTIAADEPEPRVSGKQDYKDPPHTIVLTDSCGNTTTYTNIKVLINYLEAGTSMESIYSYPNGTDISKLPLDDNVWIITTKSLRESLNATGFFAEYLKVPVNWDKESTAYDKTSKKAQRLRIYGTLDISGQNPQIFIREGGERSLHTYAGFKIDAAQTYSISMGEISHGRVFLVDRPMTDSGLKAYEGETITFRLEGEAGYTPASAKVTNKSGTEIPVTRDGEEYSYEQPKDGSIITAAFEEIKEHEIIHPEAVEGFENGTALSKIIEALPASVMVKLNGDDSKIAQAPVKWMADTANYNRNSRKSQIFEMQGTVDLSAIDTNAEQGSTQISVSVEEGRAGSGGGTTPTIPTDPSDNPTDNPSGDDANLSSVKGMVSKMLLYARSSRTPNKNIKVVLKMDEKTAASIETLKKLGYTVKYKFYISTKKSSAYKAKITKKAKTYINTSGKKGVRYYYKARILVYDKNGKLVAQTKLKQCKYACRVR